MLILFFVVRKQKPILSREYLRDCVSEKTELAGLLQKVPLNNTWPATNVNSGYLRWERNFPVACPEPSHPGIGHLQEQTFINPAAKTTLGTHNVILATQEKLCNDGPWLCCNLIWCLSNICTGWARKPLVLSRSSSSFVCVCEMGVWFDSCTNDI